MNCKIPGCQGKGSRFGCLCNAHKSRKRRHGDELQEGVRQEELKPYLVTVRKRFETTTTNTAMAMTKQRWMALLGQCRGIVYAYLNGQPSQRNQRHAASELIKVSEAVETTAIIETVLAMYLLAEDQPRRFRSDKAFLFQLVRRVRALCVEMAE